MCSQKSAFLYFETPKTPPYGDRSTEEVREFTANCIAAFIPRGIKAVVVACNTATAAAIECLRARYPRQNHHRNGASPEAGG